MVVSAPAHESCAFRPSCFWFSSLRLSLRLCVSAVNSIPVWFLLQRLREGTYRNNSKTAIVNPTGPGRSGCVALAAGSGTALRTPVTQGADRRLRRGYDRPLRSQYGATWNHAPDRGNHRSGSLPVARRARSRPIRHARRFPLPQDSRRGQRGRTAFRGWGASSLNGSPLPALKKVIRWAI